MDENGDGIPDAEDTNGIANVTITLLDGNSNVVNVTTTDVAGAYAFTNLAPGAYTVVETDPPGTHQRTMWCLRMTTVYR
ncbi:MAG: carboxypeptidase regulatory-like domain-containing protein [Verrucomicrobia bacterium]|nr:carboxypeptidase regulatory-like domain-containing protein [Verrucomicrobiota bacterium]